MSISGTPKAKYHFLVLCLKSRIARRPPTAPPIREAPSSTLSRIRHRPSTALRLSVPNRANVARLTAISQIGSHLFKKMYLSIALYYFKACVIATGTGHGPMKGEPMSDQTGTERKEPSKLYSSYMKSCLAFELAGGAILGVTILLNEVLKLGLRGFVIPAALIGAVILGIGGSSARPHNQIKAFSGQLMRNPIREVAEAMLDAFNACKTVRLNPRSYAILTAALDAYRAQPDADPELAARLSEAAEKYVKRSYF